LTQGDRRWVPLAFAGVDPPARPDQADTRVSAGRATVLAMTGPSLRPEDRRLADVFAVRAREASERIELADAAAAAVPVAEADRVRTALLAAVGHDLRAPLAAAKAVVSGLLSPAVTVGEADRRELLSTADASLDRLAGLVDNLLDMSRLQVGAMPVHRAPTAVDDVLSRALDDLGVSPRGVLLDIAAELPLVHADAGLLERVLVNLLSNAQRYSPTGVPPLVNGGVLGDRVEIRVVDRGPGIPGDKLDQVFVPFQRLGDTDNATGIGLGLAVSRGLVEAMGATLTPEETPGGGLTMVVSLPVAEPGEGDG
ncbi:MAG: ATP-binding protein, partial [Nocardioides sp.]|uniref:sensor histidine kinase n=1 Tax=Nocardioides sp. TaxID=35761 RepID=UPI0039E501FA